MIITDQALEKGGSLDISGAHRPGLHLRCQAWVLF